MGYKKTIQQSQRNLDNTNMAEPEVQGFKSTIDEAVKDDTNTSLLSPFLTSTYFF